MTVPGAVLIAGGVNIAGVAASAAALRVTLQDTQRRVTELNEWMRAIDNRLRETREKIGHIDTNNPHRN